MRRACAWCLGLVLVLGSVRAAEPQGRVVEDIWNAAHLEGAPAGFVHTTVRQIERDGTRLLHTTTELQLTVRRESDTVTLRMVTGTDETPEGKVLGISMRQFLGKQQQLVMTGTVEGDELHVRVEGGARLDKRIPWDKDVIGLYRQEHFFGDHKIKPGDTFTYRSYEPTITNVITTRVAARDYEEVEVRGVKKRLLRVEAIPDRIKASNASLQLPKLVSWVDKQYRTVRSQVEMPGLGKLVLYRTEAGKAPPTTGAVARLPRLNSLIPIHQRIARPYDTESAVYRITLKDDDDPASAFVQDDRQQVVNIRGNTFELHVRASHGPQPGGQAAAPPEECLKSCYFIKWDDPKVLEHTRRAVGRETDPWAKAKRIESYVYRHIDKKNFTEAFATADQVARTMEGDCTEHSMLAAAMCRAAGLPSRTAIGLVYVDHPRQGPCLGFHMWTEVWIDGRWIPIDATLGRGYVGATHLKITDHSWYDTQSLTPLLPVVRVLGKLSIEVIRVGKSD